MRPLERYKDIETASGDEKVEKKPRASAVYHIRGEKTPDHRQRVIELSTSLTGVLNLARAENVSLTVYMTALYMLAVYQASKNKSKDVTVTTSIPINLRQFFPSVSVRNF